MPCAHYTVNEEAKKKNQENIVNEQIHDNDIDSVKIECSESSKKYKYYVYNIQIETVHI